MHAENWEKVPHRRYKRASKVGVRCFDFDVDFPQPLSTVRLRHVTTLSVILFLARVGYACQSEGVYVTQSCDCE